MYKKYNLNNSENFKYNLIINSHKIIEKNKNYLISPYSIEIALSMLRDGASKGTKEEIENIIGTREINDITIEDRVKIINAIFINNLYSNDILSSYKNILKSNYNAEIFTYKYTEIVDKINSWVESKTNKMINKLLNNDDVDENYLLGLLNALVIDLEWENKFDSDCTTKEVFTKIDGRKIYVKMMHQNGYKYIKEKNVEGIVLPYKKYDNSSSEIEFVGLIPKNNIDDYINNDLENDINNLNNLIKIPVENENIEQIVNLSLPKFSYDYELKRDDDVNLFRTLIENIGIKKVFKKAKYYGDKNAAEFDNIANIKNIILKNPLITGIYISKAIHKTHIELTENGTKAAQVTYFGMSFEGCMPIFRKQEYIDIKFNKPFVYLIREKKTNEILFFGVIYEPDLWK